ncbi:MAG: hypothetical protein LIR50_05700 [Bacillota bacterium]|nr:hypothetical protein [Bacillota bacterium]
MKTTNRELLNKVSVLNTITQKQLPVKVSYAIAKNINTINKELSILEDEKQKLIKEYALKDEHGNPQTEGVNFKFPNKEKENECNEKYNELLDIEVEIELKSIQSEELFKSTIDFSPAELMQLDFMIND